jgi:pimeloyl-ACP methyl ester carboxylesterase
LAKVEDPPLRQLPALSTQFITIDGVRLEYQWHGPPASEAPTIVFLHEGLGSITRWRDFPAALCARLGWGGLVFNRRGYGGSDPLRPPLSPQFMHHEALDVLPRVLDAFGIAQPILFGHSDGASIALIYAGSHPDSPAALVLEAPHVFVEAVTVASIAAIRGSYRSTDLRARLERHHGPNVDLLFQSWAAVWLSDGFRRWNIEEYLPAITAPTLVIQGKDDEYGTARQVEAVAAAASAPVETHLLDGCRHSPHIDRREAVEAAAVRFLQRLEIRERS